MVLSSSLCRELDAATISLFCGAQPPQHPFLSFITLFILRYTFGKKHLCIFSWLTRTFIYKTSWVAPGWQKLRKFCRDLRSFGNLWAKKRLFGSKTVFLGQEVHYYIVYIAYFTKLKLQICDYSQKGDICRENCKYALDENFHGHFWPRRKAAKFCHPGDNHTNILEQRQASSKKRARTKKKQNLLKHLP